MRGKTVIVDLEVNEEADFKRFIERQYSGNYHKVISQLSGREKQSYIDCHDGRI